MWPPKQIDIGWSDLAAAALLTVLPRSAVAAQRRLEQCWGNDEALACLSVRSGFDLLLTALALPPGSEVLMTALTIPDMPRIVRQHGLVAVPLDIEIETLAPRTETIEAALTQATRAIVVAHLFGARVPLEPILDIARRHGLLVIEDVAQGLSGLDDRGHPAADVAMFSFGPIKTATALGGGLLIVRDGKLLARMRAVQAGYARQSRWSFLSRVAKYAALKGASHPRSYGALVAVLRRMGRDYDRLFAGLVRGFAGAELLRALRQRPALPLVALLQRRLDTLDAARIGRRVEVARGFIDRLHDRCCFPGAAIEEHSHWAVPVLSRDPPALIAELARRGFHATQGRSLAVVEPPCDRPGLRAVTAEELLAHAVFLPLYPPQPEWEQQRLEGALQTIAAAQPPLLTTVSS
jgi:perosamine synthetase